jgi:flagellar hook-associated protein 2
VLNDRVVLSNKSTGDLGVSLSDVTGNFLAATGLLSGSLERGKNLTYTINGGDPLVSQSNTITQESSGIPGLSVVALKQGESAAITVSADTAGVRNAINGFISEYNRLQSMIGTQTASSTDAQGKVTAGILANESDADTIARRLRVIAGGTAGSTESSIRRLESIGITANGNDDTITVSDTEAFESAITENLSAVKDLFTNSTSGIATLLDSYIESTIGDDGWLLKHQDNLTNQIADIDTQVIDQERYVQAVRTQLTNSFLAMEQAQQKSNQQLQFLSARFGSGGSQ